MASLSQNDGVKRFLDGLFKFNIGDTVIHKADSEELQCLVIERHLSQGPTGIGLIYKIVSAPGGQVDASNVYEMELKEPYETSNEVAGLP